MKITTRRLCYAALSEPISDSTDRNMMAMSTLIEDWNWLFETSWDGCVIGDIQIFRNTAPKGQKEEWVWWGGVPRGKIKNYKFTPDHRLTPQTLEEDEGLPFELPNAERKAKPDQAGKGGPAAA